MFVRAELFLKHGGLDDSFFAHMEEIDFCWRLQLAGYTVCVVPQSTVLHLGGGTLPQTSPWKLKLNFRNNLLMLENNLAKSYGSIILQRTGKIDLAAEKGWSKARALIFFRMLLDGASAMVYLLMLKPSYFKAVLEAHEEYRKERRQMSEAQLWQWLSGHGSEAQFHGWFGHWIVPMNFISRRKVWSKIHRFRG